MEYVRADAREPELEVSLAALGTAAGTLQSHARKWNAPEYFDRPTWDVESTLTDATSWGHWMSAELPSQTTDILRASRRRILAELPPVTGANRVLQHADLKIGNSIWSAGELHVIDFDDSGYSWPLFDLAASLTGLENLPETPQLVDAWLSGYALNAVVTDDALETIPALLMQRRLMIVGWLLAHPEGHPAINRADALADTAEMAHRYLNDDLLARSHS